MEAILNYSIKKNWRFLLHCIFLLQSLKLFNLSEFFLFLWKSKISLINILCTILYSNHRELFTDRTVLLEGLRLTGLYIGLPLNKFIQFSQFSFQDYLSGGSLNREYFNRSKNCTTPRFICFPDPDRSGWGVEEGGGGWWGCGKWIEKNSSWCVCANINV